MNINILKLRDSADILLEQGKYEAAFGIYDELYKIIWLEIGRVHSGINAFSQTYLSHNFQVSLDFRKRYSAQAANSVFIKIFGLDLDETLNEFIFTIYGRLQCFSFSPVISNEISFNFILSEYLLLYSLILQSVSGEWISSVLKIMTPIVDDHKLKKIRYNIPDDLLKPRLLEEAKKIKSTDWYALNINLLEYLSSSGERDNDFMKKISTIIGPYTSGSGKKYRRNEKSKEQKQDHQQYEKYERYEKYEKYEKFEKQNAPHQEEFDFNKATDFEKAKYFGSLFGLKGQVTKAQIRKKYLELITKYHPDKVSELGPELVELAEKKSKEINIVYEWFKEKYKL